MEFKNRARVSYTNLYFESTETQSIVVQKLQFNQAIYICFAVVIIRVELCNPTRTRENI